jgi:hypothetical protein
MRQTRERDAPQFRHRTRNNHIVLLSMNAIVSDFFGSSYECGGPSFQRNNSHYLCAIVPLSHRNAPHSVDTLSTGTVLATCSRKRTRCEKGAVNMKN